MSVTLVIIVVAALIIGINIMAFCGTLPASPQGQALLSQVASTPTVKSMDVVEHNALRKLTKIERRAKSAHEANTMMNQALQNGTLVLPDYATPAIPAGHDAVTRTIVTTQFGRPLPNIPAGTGKLAPIC